MTVSMALFRVPGAWGIARIGLRGVVTEGVESANDKWELALDDNSEFAKLSTESASLAFRARFSSAESFKTVLSEIISASSAVFHASDWCSISWASVCTTVLSSHTSQPAHLPVSHFSMTRSRQARR